jgi:hypothetical protein
MSGGGRPSIPSDGHPWRTEKELWRRHGSSRRRARAGGVARGTVEENRGGALCWSRWLPFYSLSTSPWFGLLCPARSGTSFLHDGGDDDGE